MAVADGDPGDHARMIAPGLAAPYHQHLFNVRLDMRGRRPRQRGLRGRRRADRLAGQRREPVGQRLRHDGDAARDRAGGPARRRPVAQPDLAHRQPVRAATASGSRRPTSCCPASTPTLLADPDSSVGRRAAFASHNLWVTPFDPEERRAAGDYPNQHRGRRRPADVDGAGSARSSTPTSCCGTPSASPTSPGPRTGRSCRSSTPASP